VKDLLDAALHGDFSSLFGDDGEVWWSFVRDRAELGADQVMLRVDTGTWCCWLVYEVVDNRSGIAMTQMLIPDYEKRPETAMAIPAGYEQVPYLTIAQDAAMGFLAARTIGQ